MKNHEYILDAFSKGDFEGSDTRSPKHVVTAISNVFIFGDKVYKIYKQENHLFNKSFFDLSDKTKRFQFTRSDFEWNKNLSPGVYLKILGATWSGKKLNLGTPDDDAHELVIVMNTVDTSNGVFVRLMKGDLNANDCYQIGYQLGKQISVLPLPHGDGITLHDDFIVRYRDIVEWLMISEKYIPKEEGRLYSHFLFNFIEAHKGELQSVENIHGTSIDMHSENAIYTDAGKLFTIDTYPPKEEWRKGYKHINIYRLATDVYALSGKTEFKKTLEGYSNATGEVLDEKYEEFLVMYSALIMVPYLYMLGAHDALRHEGAVRYHAFLRDYFKLIS